MSKWTSTSFLLVTLWCLSEACPTAQIPSSVLSLRTPPCSAKLSTLRHGGTAPLPKPYHRNLKTRASDSTVLTKRTLVWNAVSQVPHPEMQVQHVCTPPRHHCVRGSCAQFPPIWLQVWVLCSEVSDRPEMEVTCFWIYLFTLDVATIKVSYILK